MLSRVRVRAWRALTATCRRVVIDDDCAAAATASRACVTAVRHAATATTRATTTASSSAPLAITLNALSQRVRRLLQQQPPPLAATSSWRVTELLTTLLDAADEHDKSACVAATSSDDRDGRDGCRSALLHPLLCVHVVSLLGYAAAATTTNATTTTTASSRRGGWAEHDVFALPRPSDATTTATTLPSTAATTAQWPQTRVMEQLLLPLLPLMGSDDGASNDACASATRDTTSASSSSLLPHARVRAVMPYALEWLCVLPMSPRLLPHVWLPRLRWLYDTCTTDTTDTTTAQGSRDGDALPALSYLLPYALRQAMCEADAYSLAMTYADEHCNDDEHNNDTTTTMTGDHTTLPLDAYERRRRYAVLRSALCGLLCRLVATEQRQQQQQAQQRQQAGSTPAAAAVCDSTRAVSPSRDVVSHALSQLLFWHASRPLLTHALVQDALRDALRVMQPCSSNSDHTSATAAAAPLRFCVPVRDDDELRRLLLRLRGATTTTSSLRARVVYVQPIVSRAHDECSNNNNNNDDDDMPLRFVVPLHDYIVSLCEQTHAATAVAQTADASPPPRVPRDALCLGFAGVVAVVASALDRLQALRAHSCSNDDNNDDDDGDDAARAAIAPSHTFTLLPHKPRIHTVKRVCELLLHDARDAIATTTTTTTTTVDAASAAAMRQLCARAVTTAPQPPPPLLLHGRCADDVSAAERVALLRRLCGASRALVRAVMTEKRLALQYEGVEGAALLAGGVQRQQQQQQQQQQDNMTTTSSSVVQDATTTTTSAAAADVMYTPGSSSSDVDATLRNTAYRIVEPALLRYYAAVHACGCAPAPLQRLSLSQLTTLLSSSSSLSHGEQEAQYTSRRGACNTNKTVATTSLSPMHDATLREVLTMQWRALRELDACIGGAAVALATARHVLQRPALHGTVALVEAIRLVAMHTLLLLHDDDDTHTHDRSDNNDDNDDDDAHEQQQLLREVMHGFTHVWHALQRAPRVYASSDNDSDDSDGDAVVSSRVLRERLLLVVLLLQHRYYTRGRHTATASGAGAARLCALDDVSSLPSMHTSLSSSSSSRLSWLFALLTDGGARSEWALTPLHALLQLQQTTSTSALPSRLHAPPAGLPAGCVHVWQLCEQLRTLAAHTRHGRRDDNDSDDSDNNNATTQAVVVWRWLGTLAAVRDVCASLRTDDANNCRHNSSNSRRDDGVRASCASRHVYVLLPWTTVVQHQHVLRLYDEGAQSARMANECVAPLATLLHACTDDNDNNNNNNDDDARCARNVTVRLVSLYEEMCVLPHVARSAHTLLAPDVVVVQPEVDVEARLAAHAAAVSTTTAAARVAHLHDDDDDVDSDDDVDVYNDGLD